MSKMGSHDPFGYLKHKLWPKKGWESNYQFDFGPLKVKNHHDSLACKWCATCCWKDLDKGLQLCFRLHFNRKSTHKVMGPQSRGSPNFGNFQIPIWSPGTKWHLGPSPVATHKVYYKGEGGGFPQVQAVVSLVSPCLPMAQPCTKSAPIMH
jgi:hypothetical protein